MDFEQTECSQTSIWGLSGRKTLTARCKRQPMTCNMKATKDGEEDGDIVEGTDRGSDDGDDDWDRICIGKMIVEQRAPTNMTFFIVTQVFFVSIACAKAKIQVCALAKN